MKPHTHGHKAERRTLLQAMLRLNGANISNIRRNTRAPYNSLRLFRRSNRRPRPYKSHLTTWPQRLEFAGRKIAGAGQDMLRKPQTDTSGSELKTAYSSLMVCALLAGMHSPAGIEGENAPA